MLHSTHRNADRAVIEFASLHTPSAALGLDAVQAEGLTVSANEDAVLVEPIASVTTSQQLAVTPLQPATTGGGMDSAMLGLGLVGAWLLLIGVAMLARRFRALKVTALSDDRPVSA